LRRKVATSVGGTATGEGGDRIVVDDPHNVNEAESDLVRRGVIDWWDQVMSTRLNDPKTGAKVIVMQRVHEADLAGHVLAQGGYEHLCLPAEYEGPTRSTMIGWSDPRTEAGELLWPERFGPDEINALKRSMGSYASAGQLQQRPAPAEGGILKRHWWRYWKPVGASLPPVAIRLPDGQQQLIPAIDLPESFDEQVQSWDMAFKDIDSSDYVVGQVWAKKQADKFLLHQVKARLDFPKTLDAVRKTTTDWPHTHAKLVEDKANGTAVIATLKHEISGMIPVNPEGGKESRASAVSPQIESGTYRTQR
jgi:phage terminase large subunit-like protein